MTQAVDVTVTYLDLTLTSVVGARHAVPQLDGAMDLAGARHAVPQLDGAMDLAGARHAVPQLDGAMDLAGARHAVPPWDLRREPRESAAAVSAAMYRAVGGSWHWTDRLSWTDADWDRAVNRDDVELWLLRVDGDVAGYFELHAESDAVELKYFGLRPEFTGRRIGGPLLSAAIDRARQLEKPRMTVNTCTLDHPSALPNYLKRGFAVVRTEVQRRTLPS